MSTDELETKTYHDKEPLAYAYDDTDGELIAELYEWEVVAEFKDAWWIRVEECGDE